MDERLYDSYGAFSVHIADRDGDPFVIVAGDVDTHTAEPITAAVITALGQASITLVMDLSAVTFFGSAGINMLIDARARAAARDVPLRVVVTPSMVLRALQVTRLDHLFDLRLATPDARHGVVLSIVD